MLMFVALVLSPARRAARRGALLLDKENPDGWTHKIDKEKLDVAHAEHCPLGQVYGQYSRGADRLGLHERTEKHYGFFSDTMEGYRALNRAWNYEIDRRLRSAA